MSSAIKVALAFFLFSVAFYGALASRELVMLDELCDYNITASVGCYHMEAFVNFKLSNAEGEAVTFTGLDKGMRNPCGLDTYDLKGKCVPNICQMEFWLESIATMPNYSIDNVEVKTNRQNVNFVVRNWLSVAGVTVDYCLGSTA
eukprot:c17122_g1_i1 orf=432-866(-)